MTDSKMNILFGTQTGCSQEVAESIARELFRHGLNCNVVSMSEFDVSMLPETTHALFVCSTTGNGETPDAMKKFWRFLLRKDLPNDSLCNLNYSVFGLGDSSYPQFNVVGKRLFKRLAQLGAQAFHRRGDADDQHPLGIDGELIPWTEELCKIIMTLFPLPPGASILPRNMLLPPKYSVNCIHPAIDLNTTEGKAKSFFTFENTQYFIGSIAENTRISDAGHDQDIRHIEINIQESGLRFEPGDVAIILPKSRPQDVERLLKRFGWDENIVIDAKATAADVAPLDLPFPCTLKRLLTEFMGVSSTPKRYFFELISHFASEERERERLQYFASPEGKDDLVRYNDKEKRTVVEVFEDFPSVMIPIEYLFDVIPRQKPRYFSISSSLKLRPGKIQLTVGVVRFTTPFKRVRTGLCSSWLAQLTPSPDTLISVGVKSGSIRLPQNPQTPIIMVGPGTGCAPFRSFVEHLYASQTKGTARLFFFGCRYSQKDWIYANQMKMLESEGIIGKYVTAFSRDTERKVYVQHRLMEEAETVWRILSEEGGVFYLSGSANQMPKDVRAALRDIACTKGGLTEEEAVKLVKELEYKGRIQVEVWS